MKTTSTRYELLNELIKGRTISLPVTQLTWETMMTLVKDRVSDTPCSIEEMKFHSNVFGWDIIQVAHSETDSPMDNYISLYRIEKDMVEFSDGESVDAARYPYILLKAKPGQPIKVEHEFVLNLNFGVVSWFEGEINYDYDMSPEQKEALKIILEQVDRVITIARDYLAGNYTRTNTINLYA